MEEVVSTENLDNESEKVFNDGIDDLVYGLQNLRNNKELLFDVSDFSNAFLQQFFSFFLMGNARMSEQAKAIGDVESIAALLDEKKHDLEIVSQMGQKIIEAKLNVEAENSTLKSEAEQMRTEIMQLKDEVAKKNELLGILYEKDSSLNLQESSLDYSDTGVVSKLNDRITGDLKAKVANLDSENKKLRDTTLLCLKETESLEHKETMLIEEINSVLTQTQVDFQKVSNDLNNSNQELQRQEEDKGRVLRELVDAHRKNRVLSTNYESLVNDVDYLQSCIDEQRDEQIRSILQKYPPRHTDLVGQARWRGNNNNRRENQNRKSSARGKQNEDKSNPERLAQEQERAKREALAKQAADRFYEETMRDKERSQGLFKNEFQAHNLIAPIPVADSSGSGKTYAQVLSRHQSMDCLSSINGSMDPNTSVQSPVSRDSNAMMSSSEKAENFYGREFTPSNKGNSPLNSKYSNGPLHGNREISRNWRKRAQNQEELLNYGPMSVTNKDFNTQNRQNDLESFVNQQGVHSRLGYHNNGQGMKRYNSNLSLSGYDYNEVSSTDANGSRGKKRNDSTTKPNRKHSSSQSRTRSDTYNENSENYLQNSQSYNKTGYSDGAKFEGKNAANFSHANNKNVLNRYGSLNHLNY